MWEFRSRIGIAIVFLLVAKIATILVPVTLKNIVDWFNPALNPDGIHLVPVFLVIAFGLLVLASTLFEELRNTLFLGSNSEWFGKSAFKCLSICINYPMRSIKINRTVGFRAILKEVPEASANFFGTLFSPLPRNFEITVICIFLLITLELKFVFIIAVTIVTYFLFTYYVTRWRRKYRVRMNDADPARTRRVLTRC